MSNIDWDKVPLGHHSLSTLAALLGVTRQTVLMQHQKRGIPVLKRQIPTDADSRAQKSAISP